MEYIECHCANLGGIQMEQISSNCQPGQNWFRMIESGKVEVTQSCGAPIALQDADRHRTLRLAIHHCAGDVLREDIEVQTDLPVDVVQRSANVARDAPALRLGAAAAAVPAVAQLHLDDRERQAVADVVGSRKEVTLVERRAISKPRQKANPLVLIFSARRSPIGETAA
jgi:hypothetical protein